MYSLFMLMDKSLPRDAATVVVVRDGEAGLEVLLLRRAERGDHNSGAWVFPGGLLDASDREMAPAGAFGDADASARLGLERGGLAFHVAALRECFEEAGILFAVDAQGRHATVTDELAALRDPLKEGAVSLAEVLRRFSLTPTPERLHYIGHWLTPLGRAKRFDTRFFLAVAPQEQTARHDAHETLDHVWLGPADALSPANSRRLMTPTRAILELLLPFEGTGALAAWAQSPRTVERVLPRLGLGAQGVGPVLPGHPAYDEVGKLDPEGRGDVWCELRPCEPVQVSPHVVRVVGEDGRNTYCVRTSRGPVNVMPDVGTVHLVPEDSLVIAHDLDSLPPEVRASVEWLAPARGFLVRGKLESDPN